MIETAADFVLKPLSPEDLEPVIAIDAATAGLSRRNYFEKRLKAAIDRPKDYVFVGAFAGDRLAGFAFAKLVSGAFGQEGASASLDAIGVDPSRGHRGLGHALVGEVEAVLRRKGVATLASQIDWSQQPVLRFMAHAGFALSPRLVLARATAEIALALEEDDGGGAEANFSSPEGDETNALSHERIPVRAMSDRDLDRIVAIDAAGSGVERRDYYTRKQHENLRQGGVQVSLVAEQDGFPAGFVMARVDFGEFGHASPEAVLDSIGVDPGFRGNGVGRTLMATLMAQLGVLRVERVRTEVDWNDTALVGYFDALGFRPAQRIVLNKTL